MLYDSGIADAVDAQFVHIGCVTNKQCRDMVEEGVVHPDEVIRTKEGISRTSICWITADIYRFLFKGIDLVRYIIQEDSRVLALQRVLGMVFCVYNAFLGTCVVTCRIESSWYTLRT